jgi:hypothetical protein
VTLPPRWPRTAGANDETLRAVAFFAASMFTQQFGNVPPDVHLLGTPNRTA